MGLSALRRRVRRDESGLTLTEMMIVLFVLGIVLMFTLQAMASLMKSAASSDKRLQNLEQARTIMDNVSKDIRTAVALSPGTAAFVLASANEATFYANRNPTTGPVRIHLYIDSASRLVREITPPDPGSVSPNFTYTGAATARALGSSVANTATSPLFTYYDATGAVLPAPLSAADLLKVRAVGISLSIKQSGGSIPATTLMNRVRLPNSFYDTQVS